MNVMSFIQQLSDGTWVHAFGMANGLFLSAVLYMLMFSLTSLKEKGQRYIAQTFLLLSVTGLLFSLYSLYFQYSHNGLHMQYYPQWLLTLAKFSAPLALLFATDLFMRNVAVQSYDDFQRVKLIKPFQSVAVTSNTLVIFVLFFVTDPLWVLVVIQLMFLPSIISGVFINHISTPNQLKRIGINALLVVSFISCVSYASYSVYSKQTLPQPLVFFMISGYGVILILMSFAFIRFGFVDALRYNRIKNIDQDNLTQELYKAIEKDQLYLVYQPKLSLKTQRVSGFEALLRWEHPERGTISPTVFIPLAEEVNMIDNLCYWLIDHTVMQARQLLNQGYKLPISMNFSASNMHPDMVDYLTRCLEIHHVPAQMIMVEITESLLIQHSVKELTAIHMLHTLGVDIAIDDYGTGFSSLNYLRSLDVKQLKIDRSFIKNMDTHHDNHVIVKSTLQMSKGLKLHVVAEGVETAPIQQLLIQLGCDEIQGYLISPPMSSSELEQWLQHTEPHLDKNNIEQAAVTVSGDSLMASL